jgi:HEAT repeat protein
MAAPAPEIGVFTTDVSLVVRVWDDWLATATGRSADDARGRPLEDVVPELATRGLLRYFHEVLTTGAIQVLAPAFHRHLIPCPPRSPSRRFTEMQQRVTIGPLREGDRIVGTMATIEDVTARMEAERDIAESLTSDDPDVRRRAAEELARLKETDADTVVRPLLAADDWRVRQAGVNGLARIADARFVAALVDTLRDEHRNFSVLSSALKLLSLTDVNVTGPVAALLQHRDTDLRIQAALALGDQQDTAAVPALLEALSDPDANVRFHAIESLGRLRASAAVQPLLDIVESRDFFLAFAAIDALARIDDRNTAPRLVSLLPDAALRAPVIDALGGLGEEDVVAPLIRTLNDVAEDATTIAAALASIHQRSERQYGTGAGVEDVVSADITGSGVRHLLGALGAATPTQIPAVVTVLGWLQSPEVDRALTGLLGDADARVVAVEALARHGRRVVPLLLEQVDADDRATRLASIAALGRVADRRATGALLRALDDDDAEVLVATAGALAKIADPTAFEPLAPLVSHRDSAVRLAAIGALNSIGHPDMPRRIIAMLADADARTRESAVRIAGYFGYRDTSDQLLAAATGDADESVRRAAIEHLPYLDDPRVVQVLATVMQSESARTRVSAVRALARLDDPDATAALRRALEDPDSWARYHAIRGLGERRDAGAAEALVRLADEDRATPVRIAAVEAAGAIGTGMTEHLTRWAGDREHEVAAAALQGLGKAAEEQTLRPLLEALRSEPAARRKAAVGALAAHGSPDAVGALEWTASADPDVELAGAAVEGLAAVASAAGTGVAPAVEALVSLLADLRIRESVLTALARLPTATIPLLQRGLDHGVPAVRLATVEALARARHPQATAVIETALDHRDAEIREAAVLALARIGAADVAPRLSRLAGSDPSKVVRRAAGAALGRIRQASGPRRGPLE